MFEILWYVIYRFVIYCILIICRYVCGLIYVCLVLNWKYIGFVRREIIERGKGRLLLKNFIYKFVNILDGSF